MNYYVKAIYAAVIAFLGSLGGILVGDATLVDVTQGQWVFIASATVIAFGGILGWQSQPASVSTSIK